VLSSADWVRAHAAREDGLASDLCLRARAYEARRDQPETSELSEKPVFISVPHQVKKSPVEDDIAGGPPLMAGKC